MKFDSILNFNFKTHIFSHKLFWFFFKFNTKILKSNIIQELKKEIMDKFSVRVIRILF